MTALTIATRQSPLALWQAEHVKIKLQEMHPELQIDFLKMTTQGDRFLDSPLQKIGGKGLFVKELEQSLLDERADIAVHSLKDVPFELPSGLILGAVLSRENPCDVLISNDYHNLKDIPYYGRVGTSSLRRACQLRAFRPDLTVEPLRGNVHTRLKKLDEGPLDAIILAHAGISRLKLQQRARYLFSPYEMLPAIGQGVLVVQCREHDPAVLGLIQGLEDPSTRICIQAERTFNRCLEGGCHIPIGGYAEIHSKDLMSLQGLLGSENGDRYLRSSLCGHPSEAEKIGEELAKRMLQS
jgi:hydroxymethylbilane synthase